MIGRLALVTAGLIFILLGNSMKGAVWFSVKLDELVASFGAFVAVLVLLQWAIDDRLRRELIEEVASRAVGNVNIARSGLVDYAPDTYNLDLNDVLESAGDVIIGLHYNADFIFRNRVKLAERCAVTGAATKLLISNPDGDAVRLLAKRPRGSVAPDDVAVSTLKIHGLVNELNRNAATPITILHHDEILRYSFVRGDRAMWVKFQKNGTQLMPPPALKINAGSALYSFFENDIRSVVDAATPPA
jgi:hypothetical protein